MKITHNRVATHRNKKRILLIFDYDRDLIQKIKELHGRKWSKTKNCRHIPFQEDYNTYLNDRFNNEIRFLPYTNNEVLYKLKNNTKVQFTSTGKYKTESKNKDIKLPKEFEDTLKLKRYSRNTVRSYISHFSQFLAYCTGRDPKEITDQQIREYLLYLVNTKKVSISYQNQAINSIKFYYEKVLGGQTSTYYLQRPKKEKKLPSVLSEEDVTIILKQIKNLKHKCIIYLIYSAGLRLSEVINLKVSDIDSKRKTITIRGGKIGQVYYQKLF